MQTADQLRQELIQASMTVQELLLSLGKDEAELESLRDRLAELEDATGVAADERRKAHILHRKTLKAVIEKQRQLEAVREQCNLMAMLLQNVEK